MAGIRKRTWTTKDGVKKSCYEINYYLDGKQYRKSGFKTKIEAQKNLDEVTKTFKSGVTFKRLKSEFFNIHCELSCKPSTAYMYKRYLESFNMLNNVIIDNLSLKDFEKIIVQMKNTHKYTSINTLIGILKILFNFAEKYKYISKSPVGGLKKLKTYKDKAHFIEEKDINVFLEIARFNCPKIYPLLYTAIFTGMRASELYALTWQDIDFKNAKITINKQFYRGNLQTPKSQTSNRIIDISENLVKFLLNYKNNSKVICKYCFAIDNKPLSEWKVSYYFKLAKELLAISTNNEQYKKLRFHDLRHTYASVLLSNSTPVSYVQKQLGHSNCTMTLNIYNHCMPDVKFDALKILNNLEYEHKMSISS